MHNGQQQRIHVCCTTAPKPGAAPKSVWFEVEVRGRVRHVVLASLFVRERVCMLKTSMDLVWSLQAGFGDYVRRHARGSCKGRRGKDVFKMCRRVN
jgi:hypothetical protein